MKKRFWRFVESEWFLRIISLLFAFVIWLYVNESRRSIISMEVPLNFINLPPDMAIVKLSNSTVNVRIAGARWLLEGVGSFKPKAEIDLKGVAEGVNLISILPEYIKVPSYVEVALITPSTIEVEVEKVITKKVKVQLIPGESNPYYNVSVLNYSPHELELRGPRSSVKDRNEVSIYFRVEKWKEGTYRTVLNPTPDIVNAEFIPGRVELEYMVERREEVRILRDVKVITAGLKVRPDRVKVTLRGWVKTLEELDENGIKITVDPKTIRRGRANLKIEVPDGIEILDVDPKEVMVF